MTEVIFIDPKKDVVAFTVVGNKIVRIVDKKGMGTTLNGISLNPTTIIIEHPDLKGKPIGFIRKEGLRRLKEKLESFKTEKETIEYIEDDLIRKHGWKGIMRQRMGHRGEKINNEVYLNKNVTTSKNI